MKTIEKQHFVKIEGDVEVKKFGLIFDGKMVQLLSDHLYHDKILAIVRELSTNAYDAQVENGNKDKPFDIHLPTWNEMYFSIRDYGTGMSAEKVDLIYRHYGGSDRTESNEFIGGKGLGSKTPFCYNTKTFTVDVWYNGVHTCYSAYIGEDGIPCIAKMSEGPSDEPTGVCIKLPVKQYDDSNFAHAAEKVYRYFDIMPNLFGNKIQVQKVEYSLESNDRSWKLRKVKNGECRVVMGNVAYPVKFDDANITTSQKNVMNSPFDIIAEVGSLSTDNGREGLSYDNRTKTHIRYHINKIVTDFNAKIQSEIDKCVNLWEARKKYAELHDVTEVRVTDGSKIEYNGTKLFDSLTNTVSLDKYIQSGDLVLLSFTNGGWRQQYEKRRINSLSVKTKFKFYENDLNIGGFVRAGYIARTEDVQVILFKFKDAAAKAAVIATMGCDDSYFTKISTIPSPTVRSTTGPRGNIGRVVSFNQGVSVTYVNKSGFWTSETDVDFDEDGGLYVEFNRFSYRHHSGSMTNPCELARIVEYCGNAGISVPIIYGIKTADLGKITRNPDWQCFNIWIIQQVQNRLNSINIDEVLYYHKQLQNIGQNRYDYRTGSIYHMGIDQILRIGEKCNKKGLFTSFYDKVRYANDLVKSHQTSLKLQDLVSILGVPMTKKTFVPLQISLDKLETDVYNKYKLLGGLESGTVNKMYTEIVQYIDMMS